MRKVEALRVWGDADPPMGMCAEDPIRGEDRWKCHSEAKEVNKKARGVQKRFIFLFHSAVVLLDFFHLCMGRGSHSGATLLLYAADHSVQHWKINPIQYCYYYSIGCNSLATYQQVSLCCSCGCWILTNFIWVPCQTWLKSFCILSNCIFYFARFIQCHLYQPSLVYFYND